MSPLSRTPPPFHPIPVPIPIPSPTLPRHSTRRTCELDAGNTAKENEKEERITKRVGRLPPDLLPDFPIGRALTRRRSISNTFKRNPPSPLVTTEGHRGSTETVPTPSSPPTHHLLRLLLNKNADHVPDRPFSLLRILIGEPIFTVLMPWRTGKVAERDRDVTLQAVLLA